MPLVNIQEMHTERCITDMQKYQEELRAYREKYPYHCTWCFGWGAFHSTYDPAPDVPGSGWFDEVEYCEKCVLVGRCPRCGDSYPLSADEEPLDTGCSQCKFVVEKDCGQPESPECFCYEDCDVLAQEEMYPSTPREEMLEYV